MENYKDCLKSSKQLVHVECVLLSLLVNLNKMCVLSVCKIAEFKKALGLKSFTIFKQEITSFSKTRLLQTEFFSHNVLHYQQLSPLLVTK